MTNIDWLPSIKRTLQPICCCNSNIYSNDFKIPALDSSTSLYILAFNTQDGSNDFTTASGTSGTSDRDISYSLVWNPLSSLLRCFFQGVGRVEGSHNYFKMMQRLSLPSATHPSRPYYSMEELWADAPRQAWRAFRKKLGLPASSDVRILSELVKKLLALVPSPSLPYIVISYPGLIALYSEDIFDTAEYLSLRKLEGYYHYPPHEIIAAYAGHGMGLCRNIQNDEQSKYEGSQLPAHGTLLIEYTEQALLLQTEILREAVDLGYNKIHAAASFELGSSSQMDKHAYHVAEFVDQFLRKWYPDFLVPGEILVIITGNKDDTIQEAIREVVTRLVAKVELISSQSEYVAARGAAELAWRANALE